MSINWVFWTPRKRYGLHTLEVKLTGTTEGSDTIPVDIKVEIVTEHTMGYEVQPLEIVCGAECFNEAVRRKILNSVPDFLEVGKVLINEN